MKRIALVVVACACVLAVLPIFAEASHRVVKDGNDTKMVLDIHRVSVEGSKKPRWIIKTWNRWTVRRIYDRGYLMVRLDTFGSDRPDYYALIRGTASRLEATLFRDRERKPDKEVARLRVSRPDKKSVRVRIPLYLMERGSPTYRWFVETLMTTDRCPRVCFDRAPNKGFVTEPGTEPTPTPTVTTPTITPSPTVTP